MIDLHFHLLPGVDDGPPDLDSSVALARAALNAGVDTIVATPHVSWEWQNSVAAISDSVCRVQVRLAELAIPIKVVAGAEIALTRAIDLSDDELRGLSLGGGPWLLVELPQTSSVLGVEALLLQLQQRGHRIVLAHVERCPTFFDNPDVLARLVQSGMLASLTAGALVGRLGKTLQRFANRLVCDGLVSNVASDAHDCLRRPPGLAQQLADAGLSEQRRWLTHDVPAAIIGSTAIPPAPLWPRAPRRRLSERLLR